MQIIYAALFALAVFLIYTIVTNIGAILMGLLTLAGCILGAALVGWLAYLLCKWLYYKTPWGKRALKEERIKRDQAKREEFEARRRAMEARRLEEERLNRVLECLKEFKIIVDTNVFMDAAEGSNTAPEAVLQSNRFFRGIVEHRIKVHVLVSQLNELQHLKKGDDQTKQYKARCAQRIIEELQRLQVVELYGDPNARERYADAEIIKVARKLARQNRKLLVITNDHDLTIRVRSIDGVRCRAVSELYKGDTIF